MSTSRSTTTIRPLFAVLGALVLLSGLMPLARVATVAAAACPGAVVDLTTANSAVTENFDTLSNTAGSTTNVLALPGWYMTETGGGARDNEVYAVDTGGSTTGDTYSYGATAATDRAFGGLRSGTLIPSFGGSFRNGTGSPITSLAVAYTGEEWRNGTAGRTDQINLEYSLDATDLTSGAWTNISALNFVTPDTTAIGAKNGNAAGFRTARSATITGLNIPAGDCVWIRWVDVDVTGADDGLAVDDFSITPNPAGTDLSINDVSQNEGNAGTTTFTFAVILSSPAPAGGVTFDIATANNTADDASDYVAQTLTGQTIPEGSSTYPFYVTVNGDTTVELNETFFVNVTNVSGTGVTVTDGQGQGTIQNDDTTVTAAFIHDVQGASASTPVPGATVQVEGVVVGTFQGSAKLQGFFLQEEDADADASPLTSEGIFVFCGGCSVPVAEGQRVRATGAVSEFNGMTEITASAAGSVVVTDAGNNLAQVTPSPIDLPIAGVVDDFYEAREGMKVTFTDTLAVSEYFEMARFGQVILYEGGRPEQFTENNAPSVAGLNAHADDLARRKVILDDDDNGQESFLSLPNGQQSVYYPQANGGFGIGTQGSDFFRGGDTVANLTGILQWGFPGFGADTWRIRPTSANPTTFTPVNTRPVAPPAVGGAIKAVGMNLLNYFTTIDTTASTSTGPCAPTGTLDCRGADSAAELARQRDRASVVICGLNADVYGFMELENTTPSDTITDLLGAVNALCGGSHPYAFVNTGGTLGTDAIRVQLVYRTGVLSPVGSPIVDLDPVHNRPPTAQTFDVIDATNLAFGRRFTVVANHFKSKGCPGTGGDADLGDGQGCFNATRTAQANRLLTWVNSTVIPAAGDPDVLLLGDFNSYAKEDPIAALVGGGYTDLAATLDPGSYSYLFDGQLGHLDYGFASSSLVPQVTGVGNWHINADEVDLFDYNDEVFDSPGEASFEEKPDGSALVPPRVVYQPGTPYRASDHDPVIVGLFSALSPNLSISKTADAAAVNAGSQIGFTVTATNSSAAGTGAATGVVIDDPLPSGIGVDWSIASGPGNCSITGAAPSQALHCTAVDLAPGASESVLIISASTFASCTAYANTATVTATNSPTLTANATTTVRCPNLSLSKTADAQSVHAGTQIGFIVTASNGSAAGTGTATAVVINDPLPSGTDVDWSISSGPANCSITGAASSQTLHCTAVDLAPGASESVHVVSTTGPDSAGTYSNTATLTSTNSPTITASASTIVANQAPTAVVINGQCGTGKAVTGSLTLSLQDPDGDPMTFTLASNTDPTLVPMANVVIGGSGATRTISITAADKKSGVATLTFHLSDGGVTVPVAVTVKVGTNKDETLIGTEGIDVIFGLESQDTINGLGGSDLLCGGSGDDTISGGAGNDVIDGAEGNDTISGGADNDILRGVSGNDTLTGGAGADAFSGGQGKDTATDFNAGQGDTQDGTIP